MIFSRCLFLASRIIAVIVDLVLPLKMVAWSWLFGKLYLGMMPQVASYLTIYSGFDFAK